MVVEADGAPHGLTGIVDDEVQPIAALEQLATERLDARRVAEVDAVDREPVSPLAEVRFARIASRGVAGEAGGGDDARAGAEELHRRLVTDLHARAGDEGDAAAEVRGLMPLRPVEVRAGRAHRVVEEVDAAERRLADVALPRLVELRVVLLASRRRPGRAGEGCRIDGRAAEDPGPGPLEDRRVVASLLVALAAPEGTREGPFHQLVGP